MRQLTNQDVVYVHINDAPADRDVLEQIDNQRCLPGESGVIPNRELLGILQEIGYDGPVTVEPFNQRLREVAERDRLAAAKHSRRRHSTKCGTGALGMMHGEMNFRSHPPRKRGLGGWSRPTTASRTTLTALAAARAR